MKSRIKKMVARYSGYNWFKAQNLKNGLYCFNYHRIGDPNLAHFDPNVYSCTPERFDEHIKHFKSRFRMVNIEELCHLLESKKPIQEKLALITFDDGYIDNYEVAFPILDQNKVSAVFFLPTDFIGSRQIPWWDEAAWLIRNSSTNKVKLSFFKEPVLIQRENFPITIRKVLKELKQSPDIRMEDKIAELRTTLASSNAGLSIDERLFVNWQEVKLMRAKGMDIGSHSQSHNILSHLKKEEQRAEISHSINLLESKLGEKISAFAYPVGGADSFTQDTIDLLVELGIKLGFTFIEGVNTDFCAKPYELRRIPVFENTDISALRTRMHNNTLSL